MAHIPKPIRHQPKLHAASHAVSVAARAPGRVHDHPSDHDCCRLLTFDGEERALRTGDGFQVPAGVSHSERCERPTALIQFRLTPAQGLSR